MYVSNARSGIVQSLLCHLYGNLEIDTLIHQGEITHPKDPRNKFFNDLDDETAAKHIAALVPHAAASYRTPLTYEGYRDVPTTYLICKKDASMKLEFQQLMATIPGEGTRTIVCEGGHFPMLSVPKAVADAIHDAASAGVIV